MCVIYVKHTALVGEARRGCHRSIKTTTWNGVLYEHNRATSLKMTDFFPFFSSLQKHATSLEENPYRLERIIY